MKEWWGFPILAAVLFLSAFWTDPTEAISWPQQLTGDDGTVVIYQPQPERANDVFADRSGNVARKKGDTWETRNDGKWSREGRSTCAASFCAVGSVRYPTNCSADDPTREKTRSADYKTRFASWLATNDAPAVEFWDQSQRSQSSSYGQTEGCSVVASVQRW